MSRKNPGTGSYNNSKKVGLRYGNMFERGGHETLYRLNTLNKTEKNKLSTAGNCAYLERVF